MKKARYISRQSIEVIDYDKEVDTVEKVYEEDIESMGVTDDVITPIENKPTEERTDEETKLLTIRKRIETERETALKFLSEYCEFSETDFDGELVDFETAVPYYVKKGKRIVQKWDVVKGDEGKIASKIEALKAELNASDYKVMKCYEASVLGTELPYNVEELVAERQAKRDEINRLEKMMK